MCYLFSCLQVGQLSTLEQWPSLTKQTPQGSDSCSFLVKEEHSTIKYWLVLHCKALFLEVTMLHLGMLPSFPVQNPPTGKKTNREPAGNQLSLNTIRVCLHFKPKRQHLHFLERSFRTAVGGTLLSHSSAARPLWGWLFCRTLPDTL